MATMISREQIETSIKDLISTYDGQSGLITFTNVLTAFPNLSTAFAQKDAIFGSGDVAPTATVVASDIAQFAEEYLYQYTLDAVKTATNSIVAQEIWELYMDKFVTALYALFSASQQIGRKYGGFDPDANEISDVKMIPSYIEVANRPVGGTTGVGISNFLPVGIKGSFAQPAVSFENELTNGNASASVIGWINEYFSFQTNLSAGALYTSPVSSPLLDKQTAMVVFGAVDYEGNVGGVKYLNAKLTQTKPIYFGQVGMYTDDAGSKAHVLNNGMSLFVGQSTYGYMGIDVDLTLGASSTATLNVSPLGLVFTISPTLQNNLF